MSWLTPQLQAAVLRALGLALTAAVVTGGIALLQGSDWKLAAALALGSAGAALGYRGGAEGLYDGHRHLTGNVKPSDVGQSPGAPPTPTS